MVKPKNIVTAIILTIVTCGIYGIIWFVNLNDDVNTLAMDTEAPSGGVAYLLTLVTCGIYSFFWMYKMGEKIDNCYAAKGMAGGSRGILYLILTLFGFGIVSFALMQDSINKVL